MRETINKFRKSLHKGLYDLFYELGLPHHNEFLIIDARHAIIGRCANFQYGRVNWTLIPPIPDVEHLFIPYM